nr:hypothetical protein 5 [Balneolaceae bacterium]
MSNYNVDWAMIAQQIESAPWGQKETVKERFCERLDIHKATLHRRIAEIKGNTKSVDREYEFDPENRLTRMIFDLKLTGEMMHLKRRELSTENCIQLLIDRGIDGAEDLYNIDEKTGEIRYKVSTVNRRLRELGYREKQPSKRIEADYANQVHMIDFSRSKYFQLWERDERSGDFMLKVSGKELHYKKSDTRLRTWIVQYMDDFSRLRKVKAYPETNESAFLGLEHLNYVYGGSSPQPPFEGGASEHPLRYLPLEMLRCDNGSFRRSRETQAAVEALGIHMPPQMPGSKGGTAKVENRFRSLWQQFELPLAVRLGDGATIWMSEYNELLEEFCIQELEKRHPVKRQETKGEVYEKSLADRRITQKTTTADMLQVACRVERRVVDAHLRVSLDNVYYSVPQYVNGIPLTGKTVAIHRNKNNELVGKLIEDNCTERFELERWEAASWGTFESFKKSPKVLREEQLDRGESRFSEDIEGKADSEHPSCLKADSPQGEIRHMPPRTEDAEVDSPFSSLPGGERTGRMFHSSLDAREFVGSRVMALGLSWRDVDSYFEGLMDEMPVSEAELSDVIKEIENDFDSGQLGRAVNS